MNLQKSFKCFFQKTKKSGQKIELSGVGGRRLVFYLKEKRTLIFKKSREIFKEKMLTFIAGGGILCIVVSTQV